MGLNKTDPTFTPEKKKNLVNTSSYIGKSLSETLILGTPNPQYDKRLLIDLPVQYRKTPPLEHVVYTNCFLFMF